MHKNRFWILVAVTIFLSVLVQAQIVYEPIQNPVYSFLERMRAKEVIYFNSATLPFSRTTISTLLLRIQEKKNEISEQDQLFLNWYLSEFSVETRDTSKPSWRLYEYSDTLMHFVFSPIGGYGIRHYKGENMKEQWVGARTYVTLSNWFSGQFQYVDRGEFGTYIDTNKYFSDKPGANFKTAPNGIEFSEVTGSMYVNWAWGSFGLAKDEFTWGSGNFGQVIFSQKAPSYPRIHLVLTPKEWLSFEYMHGWLSSQVYDSSQFYYTNVGMANPTLRKRYVPKYIAANIIKTRPLSWLEYSIGNSFIYSGPLRPEMFIPFMYYKVMDHNTGRMEEEDGNGQMFSDIRIKLPYKMQLYGSIFADVLEIRKMLKGDWETSWFAYTFGLKKIDAGIPYLDATIEYTRVNPWLYEHKDVTTTYKSLNYQLGHWLGQNADLFGVQFDYAMSPQLRYKFSTEFIRKGLLFDISQLYYSPFIDVKFLQGGYSTQTRIRFDVTYDLMHELMVAAKYEFTNTHDPMHLMGEDWINGVQHQLFVYFSLGLH
ncbi:MAG: hypothetical protein LWX56_10705 [Ignavibacteria bacterium]|nr:hypothetical protein [Ignavibacteria bacterium]